MTVIIETNVLIAANNRDVPQASPSCVLRCAQQLRQVQKTEILALDNQWLIIKEYRNKNSSSGQPGVGDAFLKWVLTNLANPKHCTQVPITFVGDHEIAEFPQHEALGAFDRSDRKFVAVSLVHPDRPPIFNALDSDWQLFRQPLEEAGIRVTELCPECLKVSDR